MSARAKNPDYRATHNTRAYYQLGREACEHLNDISVATLDEIGAHFGITRQAVDYHLCVAMGKLITAAKDQNLQL